MIGSAGGMPPHIGRSSRRKKSYGGQVDISTTRVYWMERESLSLRMSRKFGLYFFLPPFAPEKRESRSVFFGLKSLRDSRKKRREGKGGNKSPPSTKAKVSYTPALAFSGFFSSTEESRGLLFMCLQFALLAANQSRSSHYPSTGASLPLCLPETLIDHFRPFRAFFFFTFTRSLLTSRA